ncbi:MAG TPA: hypothetical protein HPP51_00795 [Planctomycetes bacterium]|nr:hypothetical protein [Planctomycetota bacterium]
MAKILLIIPTGGGVHERTAAVAAHLSREENVDMGIMRGRPGCYNRNNAVRIFLANKQYTHLFFLDSDTEPPLDAIEKLLKCNALIATGCYAVQMRDGLRWAMAYRDSVGKYWLQKKRPSKKIRFRVDAAGAGCLLIHRKVLEAIKWPWFRWLENEDGTQISDDIFFFKKAAEHGFTAICEPAVECRHYKEMEITQLMKLLEQAKEKKECG